MNYRFYGQFAAKDAIEPLDERHRGVDGRRAGRLLPDTRWSAFRWRGAAAVPAAERVQPRRLLQPGPVPASTASPSPRPGWTWNDLVSDGDGDDARRQRRRGQGHRVRRAGRPPAVAAYGLGIEPSMIRVAPFVWSNGGEIVDDPRRPTRFTCDTPAAREALRNFVDLRVAYGVVPTDERGRRRRTTSRASPTAGSPCCCRRAGSPRPSARSPTFDWDVAPLPTYGKPVGHPALGRVLHHRAARENKDAAWRFVEFAIARRGPAHHRRHRPYRAVAHRACRKSRRLPRTGASRHATRRSSSTRSRPCGRCRRSRPGPRSRTSPSGILENALYRGDRLDDVIRELDEQTRPLFARGETA